MKVVIGKYAGFCEGVKFAVEKADKAIVENNNIYCLGEIVHNKQIIERLENKGLKVVFDINDVPKGAKLIIRAHGEGENIYNIAREKDIEIIDTTCGNVKIIHNKIKKARENSFIIILGEKEHAEVKGDIGFAGKDYYVIEDKKDILAAYGAFKKSSLSKVCVVTQTTYAIKKFYEIEKEIYDIFLEAEVVVNKTICNATEIRQNECKEMASNVDYMVVIGGKNSANTRKLVEISEANCKNVFFIQTSEELKNEKIDNTKEVGIMAGASTPQDIIDEVKKYLEKL